MNSSLTTIIGIDCAVQPEKRGVAVGSFDGSSCSVSLSEARTDKEIADLVKKHMSNGSRVLIAIDAPLGWPENMGKRLASHNAGNKLDFAADSLFRRATDGFIKSKIGKQPLDVGADRIARTAHAALGILNGVRNDLPLAWDVNFSGIAAIEVYPAATLRSYRFPDSGYKDKEQEVARTKILADLSDCLLIQEDRRPILENADMLDAVVCVLAGVDFLRGTCYRPTPEQSSLACKEGWIWVKRNE